MTQMRDYLKQLLKDFEKWRIEQGISQKDIAATMGVTRSHLNKVINGRTLPSLQLMQAMEEQCYGTKY